MPRREKVSEEKALQQWSSLAPDQRQAVMRFEDVALIEKIRFGLQTLFEKQALMKEIPDPFENSILLKEAFEFIWSISKSKQDPGTVLADPKQYPVMVMKLEFLQRTDFVECVRCVLPDFFTPQSLRTPISKARWKELCVTEPTSVAALEQQLAKLIEQALWAMTLNPVYKTMHTKLDPLGSDKFEPGMQKDDNRSTKPREAGKRKNKNKNLQNTMSRPTGEVVSQTTVAHKDEKNGTVPGITKVKGQVDNDYISTSESMAKSSQDFIVSGRYLSMHCSNTEKPFQRLRAQPPSPWQPQQLVQYIWGQTSQFEVQGSGQIACRTNSKLPTGSTRTPGSPESSEEAACARGQWVMPASLKSQTTTLGNNMLRAVVHNTFIEVDVPSSPRPAHRTSRSLSPSHLGISRYTPQGEADDPWLWYWH